MAAGRRVLASRLGTPAARGAGRGRQVARRGRGRPARGPARARSARRGARVAVVRLGRCREAPRRPACSPRSPRCCSRWPRRRQRRRSSRCRTTTSVNVRAGPPLTPASTPWQPPAPGSTRVDVLWREVAPTRPARRARPGRPGVRLEAATTQILRGLRRAGSRRSSTSTSRRPGPRRPASATPRRGRPTARRSPGRIARRYYGRLRRPAGAPLPEVRHIEVWNEPNLAGFWMPQCRQPAGRAVAGLARAYAAAAGRELPGDQAPRTRAPQVIGGVAGPRADTAATCVPGRGSSAVGSPDFTRPGGARGSADRRLEPARLPHRRPPPGRSSCHRGTRCPRSQRQVDRLRPGAPIHVTETGYHTSYNRFHRYFVSEAQQAAWLDRDARRRRALPARAGRDLVQLPGQPALDRRAAARRRQRKPSYDASSPWPRASAAADRVGAVSDAGDASGWTRSRPTTTGSRRGCVAVESRNWHLQSRMALVLETIDRYATAGRSRPGCRVRHRLPARAARRAGLLGRGRSTSRRSRSSSPRSRLRRHRRRPTASTPRWAAPTSRPPGPTT